MLQVAQILMTLRNMWNIYIKKGENECCVGVPLACKINNICIITTVKENQGFGYYSPRDIDKASRRSWAPQPSVCICRSSGWCRWSRTGFTGRKKNSTSWKCQSMGYELCFPSTIWGKTKTGSILEPHNRWMDEWMVIRCHSLSLSISAPPSLSLYLSTLCLSSLCLSLFLKRGSGLWMQPRSINILIFNLTLFIHHLLQSRLSRGALQKPRS